MNQDIISYSKNSISNRDITQKKVNQNNDISWTVALFLFWVFIVVWAKKGFPFPDGNGGNSESFNSSSDSNGGSSGGSSGGSFGGGSSGGGGAGGDW